MSSRSSPSAEHWYLESFGLRRAPANVRPSLTARNHGIEILVQRRAVLYGRPAFHAERCYMETLTGRRAQRANSRRNRPTLRDEIGFVV
jgi:hypothetical protein